MSPFDNAVLILCGLVATIGGLWFLVTAFSEGLLWGLGTLFVPFVGLFFLILHWNKASKPFFTYFLGISALIIWSVLTQPQGAPWKNRAGSHTRSLSADDGAPTRTSGARTPAKGTSRR